MERGPRLFSLGENTPIHMYMYIHIYIYIYIYMGKGRACSGWARAPGDLNCMMRSRIGPTPIACIRCGCFRGGLVFKAHRLVYHSTRGSRAKTKKKKKKLQRAWSSVRWRKVTSGSAFFASIRTGGSAGAPVQGSNHDLISWTVEQSQIGWTLEQSQISNG